VLLILRHPVHPARPPAANRARLGGIRFQGLRMWTAVLALATLAASENGSRESIAGLGKPPPQTRGSTKRLRTPTAPPQRLAVVNALGPVPEPPFWWGGSSWRGEMRFRSEFAEANLALADPAVEFTCGSADHITRGIEVYLGTHQESFMNFTVSNRTISAGLINPFPMVGSVLYMPSNAVEFPSGVDIEDFLLLEVSGLAEGRKLVRKFATAYLKLGRATFAGNHDTARIVESFIESSSGSISSFPTLRTARRVECTPGDKSTVITTLVRNDWAWHAAPWTECAGPGILCSGSRTRAVDCRDSYGKAGPAARCAGTKPANSSACATAACRDDLIRDGETPGVGRADGVLLPAALIGNWSLVLQTFDGADMSPLPAAETVVRPVDLEISANETTGVPTIRIHDTRRLYRYDSGAENATDLGEIAEQPLFPAATAQLLASGDGDAGRMDLGGHDSAGHLRLSSIAYARANLTTNAGGCLQDAQFSRHASMAVALSPHAPSAGPAFGVDGRRATSLTNTMPGAAYFAAEPNSSVLVGIAVPGPASYIVPPMAACAYYSDSNSCLRKRPPTRCSDRLGNPVAPAFCAGAAEPAAALETQLACSGCLRYDVGAWSECDKICESGIAARTVRCVGLYNESRSMRDCEALLGPQPPRTQACNAFACSAYHVGEWSQCSSPCGPASKSRSVECRDINGVLPESRCVAENRTRPDSSLPCFLCPCEDGSLRVSPVVRNPPRPSQAGAQAMLSSALQLQYTTSTTFCGGSARLLRMSEFRCYPAADQARMCATLNSAPGDALVPFVLRAEAGAAISVPGHVPAPNPATVAADIVLVRPDPSCFFSPFGEPAVGFVDRSRQAGVGLCREVRV